MISRTVSVKLLSVNTLRPRQNGCRFADDIFKRIFLNENVWILIKISLKFVPKGPINNNPALVQIMAWRRSGNKSLFKPMMVSLLTHICVARPQWVKCQRASIMIVNIGSGNGLVPSGNKLLPEPMLNNNAFQWIISQGKTSYQIGISFL